MAAAPATMIPKTTREPAPPQGRNTSKMVATVASNGVATPESRDIRFAPLLIPPVRALAHVLVHVLVQ